MRVCASISCARYAINTRITIPGLKKIHRICARQGRNKWDKCRDRCSREASSRSLALFLAPRRIGRARVFFSVPLSARESFVRVYVRRRPTFSPAIALARPSTSLKSLAGTMTSRPRQNRLAARRKPLAATSTRHVADLTRSSLRYTCGIGSTYGSLTCAARKILIISDVIG